MHVELADPLWRTKSIYSIVDKQGNQVQFYPNAVQQKVRNDKSKRKMVLKARQMGISTSEIISMFDWVCFNRNANACVLAHEQDSIKKLFRIVQRAYKFWPKQLEQFKPRLDRGGGSKYEMFFPDINSRIYCDLESRSDTIGWLHVSEAAFMKDSAKLKSTLQAVPMGSGRVTLETTANGMANHYYDMWNDPEAPYSKLFYPWFIFKEYKLPVFGKLILSEDEKLLIKKAKKQYGVIITEEQINFRRFKKAELKTSSYDKTRVTFEQEYPEDDQSCFLASGDAVMDLFKIKAKLDACTPPLSESDGMVIHKRPVKGRHYIIGADPAEGVKKDFSVGVMLDLLTKEVVCKIRGQWKPSVFATKLFKMGELYSSPGGIWPLMAVERNNHGHAVLLALDEIEQYPNIYVYPVDERQGWRTDGISRSVMMNTIVDAIEDGHIRVNDTDILNECLTLIDNNGKIEASGGKYDDCITASAIALQVCLASSLSVYDDLDSKIRS